MSSFGASSTTNEVITGISLADRVAVITGASSGLGVETARVLAAAGATVLLVARNEEKLAAAADALRGEVPAERVLTYLMDLADLDSVRRAAAEIARAHPAIHLLINNAGVMACPLMRTAQGFEMQFGTNHLGHFLFTCLLAPALLAAAPGRVVNLSSGAHRMADVNLDDPNYEERDYEQWQAYGQSKSANVLFTVALDERLRDRGIRAFAVHPGVIMTELGRHLDDAALAALMAMSPAGGGFEVKTVEQGAATTVWAATSPELAGAGGLYLEDCHIAEPATADSAGGVEAYALDADRAARLWRVSEALVGQSFDL